jgi:hypothetical protein
MKFGPKEITIGSYGWLPLWLIKKIIKEKKTQLYMNGCNFSCKKNS